MKPALILSYSGCGSCRKALKWLKAHQVAFEERAIVEAPLTLKELTAWVKLSGLPLKKWLNTSGQSYRALGKAKVDAADDATLMRWLVADGKLIKRPVLIVGERVLVGFNEEQYRAVLER